MAYRTTFRRARPGAFFAAAVAAHLLASPAQGFETLDLRLSGPGAEDVQDGLAGVLLLRGLSSESRAEGPEILSAAQADYGRLLEALYAQGYYGASLSILLDGREAATIPPLSAPETVDAVTVEVQTGRRFRIGAADIRPLPPGTPTPEALRRDEPALATAVRGAARASVGAWRDIGHAKAAIADQAIVADHDDRRLDVAIRLDPGPRLRFGDVAVRGDTAVSHPRVRQVAGIPRGAVYSPEDMQRAGARLRRTGTFRSVTLTEAETPGTDGTLDVTIDVVDRAPRRIGAGAEISSQQGLTLSGFWLHRNILGGAEQLRIEGRAAQLGGGTGGPDFSLSARFERPAVYGPDTRFFALAGIDYLDEPDYLERTARLEFGASREFTDTLTGSLGVSLRAARVTDRFLGALPDGNFPERNFTLFSVPTALTWDRRDDPLNPAGGFYLAGEVEPFAFLSGNGDPGARVTLDARAYRGVGERVVLVGRAQVGALFGVDAADAPPEFLFYSGGGGTVRGQPYRSLDADYGTARLGGRSFAGLSGEARIGITDAISLVTFADAGFIGTDAAALDGGAWHAGAGIGVRYDTTIGPLRIDLAGPVGGDTGDGIQLYLGIGQAF